jgi:CRISPR/Cas system endoribonuclease Cas6 (RAMP superfamily)
MPLVFARYREVWSAFSTVRLPAGTEQVLQHVRVTDFKISCAASPFGPGAKGWVTVEMEKGRTEQEIALFNGLIDFAFYCGTGLHTEEGLGQTRRMDRL